MKEDSISEKKIHELLIDLYYYLKIDKIKLVRKYIHNKFLFIKFSYFLMNK